MGGTATQKLRQRQRFLVGLQNSHLMPWRLRRAILGSVGMTFGPGSFVEPSLDVTSAHIRIGAETYINSFFLVDGSGPVTIGSHVRVGPSVKLLTATHQLTDEPKARASHAVTNLPLMIGDGVWLGAGAIVLPGCSVRAGCVVGAGAVVTRDTEPNGLYLGTPARRVKDLPATAANEAA